MPSIFDFDQTISIKHTFRNFKLGAVDPSANHFELGKKHALGNIKKQIENYLKHDNDNLSAVATWHNNADFIAGYLAIVTGKELTLEKTMHSKDGLIAINQYRVTGVNKPFLISYIPHANDDAFQNALTLLKNKNRQIAWLHKKMLKQQLIQEDSIIDFYEDTRKNFEEAKKLPYIKSHLVDNTGIYFNIIEMQRVSPRKIFNIEPKVSKPKLSDLQNAVAEAQKKYSAYHTNGTYKRWETAGYFSFFRHGYKGQEMAIHVKTHCNQCNNADDLLDFLDSHVTKNTTRFYRHSFVSYLLDEISSFAHTHLKNQSLLTCDANKHYHAGNWTNALPALKSLMGCSLESGIKSEI